MTLDPEVFVRLRGKIPSTPLRTARGVATGCSEATRFRVPVEIRKETLTMIRIESSKS